VLPSPHEVDDCTRPHDAARGRRARSGRHSAGSARDIQRALAWSSRCCRTRRDEGFATIAWLLGWVLLVGAVIAAAAWLLAAIRDAIAERRASIINAITFTATIAITILAVIIAPLTGTGSAQA
jgi:hypothetical protein